MIAILDYGVGNTASIKNMLKRAGERDCLITRDQEQIAAADKLILPGVGAFDEGMRSLRDTGLVELLTVSALEWKKPILGICLGMQLLGNSSEEGNSEGLGFIDMHCTRFAFDEENSGLKIPHMGWDYVSVSKPGCCIANGISDPEEPQRYYFVHSYHAVCSSEADVLMRCDYGYPFAAAVQKENIIGVQFHPEKSHMFGMRLLKNFVELC
ncbi:MAG: imidazole glycerol phosphate synthase subunit HisH [Actinobacteria bacterium]|nr:imidazole glycerol phosphate synthase subunit HisH [Actinomycetota bacterium]